jgi:hypothetical protein
MTEVVFKPKYQIRVVVSFLIMIPLGWFIVIYMLINGIGDLIAFFSGLAFALCVFLLPLLFYKRIVFKEYVLIERYFIRPRIIYYSDIKDVGLSVITTKKGHIPIQLMKNSGDFVGILFNKIENENNAEHRLEGRLIVGEIVTYKAFVISIPITIVIEVILIYYNLPPPGFDNRLVYFLTWLGCFLVTYLILKRRDGLK